MQRSAARSGGGYDEGSGPGEQARGDDEAATLRRTTKPPRLRCAMTLISTQGDRAETRAHAGMAFDTSRVGVGLLICMGSVDHAEPG